MLLCLPYVFHTTQVIKDAYYSQQSTQLTEASNDHLLEHRLSAGFIGL